MVTVFSFKTSEVKRSPAYNYYEANSLISMLLGAHAHVTQALELLPRC